MDISQMKSEITSLRKRAEVIERKLHDSLVDTIRSTDSGDRRKSSFTVKVSELYNKPWSPVYYNRTFSINIILDYLEKKSPLSWKQLLEDMLSKTKDPVVEINRVRIDRGLIEEIVKRI